MATFRCLYRFGGRLVTKAKSSCQVPTALLIQLTQKTPWPILFQVSVCWGFTLGTAIAVSRLCYGSALFRDETVFCGTVSAVLSLCNGSALFRDETLFSAWRSSSLIDSQSFSLQRLLHRLGAEQRDVAAAVILDTVCANLQ